MLALRCVRAKTAPLLSVRVCICVSRLLYYTIIGSGTGYVYRVQNVIVIDFVDFV